VLHSVDTIQKSIVDLQADLKEAYGDCTIDINDGTIGEPQDESDTKN